MRGSSGGEESGTHWEKEPRRERRGRLARAEERVDAPEPEYDLAPPVVEVLHKTSPVITRSAPMGGEATKKPLTCMNSAGSYKTIDTPFIGVAYAPSTLSAFRGSRKVNSYRQSKGIQPKESRFPDPLF